MPEYPDVTVYIDALSERVLNQPIQKIRIGSPFVLRSFDPPIGSAEGKKVVGLRRMGKRIVFELEDELYLIVHLMIAGRFHWKQRGAKIRAQVRSGGVRFSQRHAVIDRSRNQEARVNTLSSRRSSIERTRSRRPGSSRCESEQFREALTRENHTVKRSLTDPHFFSGIGNAYSDEILHRAKLSPIRLTGKMTDEEIQRLYHAIRDSLKDWVERLRKERGKGFPEKVTAFRPDMAVHGKYRKPCPVCGSPVQRIVHAENETNYCASARRAESCSRTEAYRGC